MHYLLRSKSTSRNSAAFAVAAPIALAAGRNAIPEIRARYGALDSLGSARSITLTRTDRHIKATCLRGV
jgi:hypothetical protein